MRVDKQKVIERKLFPYPLPYFQSQIISHFRCSFCKPHKKPTTACHYFQATDIIERVSVLFIRQWNDDLIVLELPQCHQLWKIVACSNSVIQSYSATIASIWQHFVLNIVSQNNSDWFKLRYSCYLTTGLLIYHILMLGWKSSWKIFDTLITWFGSIKPNGWNPTSIIDHVNYQLPHTWYRRQCQPITCMLNLTIKNKCIKQNKSINYQWNWDYHIQYPPWVAEQDLQTPGSSLVLLQESIKKKKSLDENKGPRHKQRKSDRFTERNANYVCFLNLLLLIDISFIKLVWQNVEKWLDTSVKGQKM